MKNIPVYATELGLDEKSYLSMAESVKSIHSQSLDSVNWLMEMYKFLPRKRSSAVSNLAQEMVNDPDICKRAGIDPKRGTQSEFIFTLGIIRYLAEFYFSGN